MAQAQTATQPTGVAGTKLVMKMAEKQDLDPQAYASTVMKSCFDPKNETTPEQFMAFMLIAREHGLNPITREIYAFAKGGKVHPIVSIDGWLKIINEHPQFDGMKFLDVLDDAGNLVSITCQIYRKDREIPTEVTEYLDECRMPTEPWNKWPARMLRHKATIQGARYAFGFAGIYDPDEAQRIDSGDIQGQAYVVEDEPTEPAKRIVQSIKARVEKEDLAPETDAQEVSEAQEAEAAIAEGESMSIAGTEGEVITADGEVIPGLKKASELSKENQEWVEDMEKDK
ncbi:MAG: recombinase RecT [Gammaproteobacteria bacterium]|nr:recombinase RecT [Gammaproteobacteria bacterium]